MRGVSYTCEIPQDNLQHAYQKNALQSLGCTKADNSVERKHNIKEPRYYWYFSYRCKSLMKIILRIYCWIVLISQYKQI